MNWFKFAYYYFHLSKTMKTDLKWFKFAYYYFHLSKAMKTDMNWFKFAYYYFHLIMQDQEIRTRACSSKCQRID